MTFLNKCRFTVAKHGHPASNIILHCMPFLVNYIYFLIVSEPSLPECPADREYKKLLQWYIRQLTCNVCLCIITPPVYQVCKFRHSVCRDCSMKLHECPVCGDSIILSRNYNMEDIAVDLPVNFNCRYSRWGCPVSLPYLALINHNLICQFQNIFSSATQITQTESLNSVPSSTLITQSANTIPISIMQTQFVNAAPISINQYHSVNSVQVSSMQQQFVSTIPISNIQRQFSNSVPISILQHQSLNRFSISTTQYQSVNCVPVSSMQHQYVSTTLISTMQHQFANSVWMSTIKQQSVNTVSLSTMPIRQNRSDIQQSYIASIPTQHLLPIP